MLQRITSRLRIAISRASMNPRNMSNTAGVAPGVPPAAQSSRTPTTFMSFAMPDVSIQEAVPQPQIPYSPDFWESAKKESEITLAAPKEEALPKLSVVSEMDTPTSHNLHVETPAPPSLLESTQPAEKRGASGQGGILQDISEDLGIPSAQQLKAGVSSLLQSFR
ncbi:hypothetical protein R3P38DRAFT_2997899 [Favolaschia claudopus]|uniref:Uncharacterized protein n=1 Tax=Favolaschia claudopus TaxID=2862362 RepID=A0AAW0APH7_9AGAR